MTDKNRSHCFFHQMLLLTLLFFVFIQANAQNFYFDNWKPKTFEIPVGPVQKEIGIGESTITISLSPTDTIAPVLPTQLGLNTTFRSGTEMYTKRLQNYRNSGMGAFRFPAGSGSNSYFWDGNIPTDFLIEVNPINGKVSKDLNVEEFLAFIDSMDAEATIVVNYFYARYGKTASGTRKARVNQAAEYAAGFVNYVNNVLKAGIKNWEVGNECYGKWEVGFDVNGNEVTGKEYGEDFRIFTQKMKAVDPNIKVGAVMWPKDDNWNEQVMKEVKNEADFLVVHNYFTTENEATVENIYASTVQINEIKKQMEDCTIRNTTYPADYFPVSMTEYNNRGPHTTTFVNACFTADVLGRLMESGYGLATRWVGEWRWKVGTHGLFALDDPDQADYSVRPAYMIYHYLDRAFGDQMIKTVSNNNNLWVYGSRFSDGKFGIMVINPSGSIQNFNLKTGNTGFEGKAWWYEVYANTIDQDDKKFYVNGFTSDTSGGGPADFISIQPFESEVKAETKFQVRKFSVSFFVFRAMSENSLPSAMNDYFETFNNQALSASVANNDTFSQNGSGVFSIEQNPAYGSVSMQANGDFTYISETKFNGLDSFNYSLCDALGACDTATVKVEIKLPLSVKLNDETGFGCYPNPAGNSIQLKGVQAGDLIEVISVSGIVMKKLVVTEKPVLIDLSNLGKGTYLIRSGKMITRFVRE
jgi:hypothetical protein